MSSTNDCHSFTLLTRNDEHGEMVPSLSQTELQIIRSYAFGLASTFDYA